MVLLFALTLTPFFTTSIHQMLNLPSETVLRVDMTASHYLSSTFMFYHIPEVFSSARLRRLLKFTQLPAMLL